MNSLCICDASLENDISTYAESVDTDQPGAQYDQRDTLSDFKQDYIDLSVNSVVLISACFYAQADLGPTAPSAIINKQERIHYISTKPSTS